MGLTALHGFLVGDWLEVEGEDDGLAAVYGTQQLSTGGGWNSAILFAAEEEEGGGGRVVTLRMSGLPSSSVLYTSYTLQDRGSAYDLWRAMGKPLNPTRLQAEALADSAALRHSPVQHLSQNQGGRGNLTLTVPGPGALMIRFCSNSTSPPPQPYWLTALPGWNGSLFLSWRIPASTSCVTSFQLEFSTSHSIESFAPWTTGLLTMRTVTLFR